MNCISASDMPFKMNKIFFLTIIFLSFIVLSNSFSDAKIIDRIAAYVNDTAITCSEVKENYEKTKKTMPDITVKDVIISMINRQLLIDDAKRLRLEAENEDAMLKLYIDIKIGALIFIKEEDILNFYNEHLSEFEGKEYLSVRDEIEKYLFHLEMNKRIKEHLENLWLKSDIKIFLTDL